VRWGNDSCLQDNVATQQNLRTYNSYLGPTTITATGNHWVVTTQGAHCTVVVGDVVGNDRYDVQAVNDDCTVATSDAAAAASQIAQGMADGTMLH
jgi:hypothetical protein